MSNIRIRFVSDVATQIWLRQFPNAQPTWGKYQFLFEDDESNPYDYLVNWGHSNISFGSRVPKSQMIFVAAEPENVQQYAAPYLNQFGHVLTTQSTPIESLRHVTQVGLPWHAGIDFDQPIEQQNPIGFDTLKAMESPTKTASVSIITSRKSISPYHQKRINFVESLKSILGDELDIFGRGFDPIPDKRQALEPYHYHIALENCEYPHYWTEKIGDPYLFWSFPFYVGCPNLEDYFPDGSFIRLDIADPRHSAEQIQRAIQRRTRENRIDLLREARQRLLHEHNLFAMLSRFINKLDSSSNHQLSDKLIRVRPESQCITHSSSGLLNRSKRKIKSLFPKTWECLRSLRLYAEDFPYKLQRGYRSLKTWVISQQAHTRAHTRWLAEKGTETLLYDHELNDKSIVYDVGGYFGDWTQHIHSRFTPNIWVFEPHPQFHKECKSRFTHDSNIHCMPYGLGASKNTLTLSDNQDASSVMDENSTGVKVVIRDAIDVIHELGHSHINLMKLNIEGSEFDLLERLIETRKIASIDQLLIQFHLNVPSARRRYSKLRKQLQKTHRREWHYYFVWEKWIRKPTP